MENGKRSTSKEVSELALSLTDAASKQFVLYIAEVVFVGNRAGVRASECSYFHKRKLQFSRALHFNHPLYASSLFAHKHTHTYSQDNVFH